MTIHINETGRSKVPAPAALRTVNDLGLELQRFISWKKTKRCIYVYVYIIEAAKRLIDDWMRLAMRRRDEEIDDLMT